MDAKVVSTFLTLSELVPRVTLYAAFDRTPDQVLYLADNCVVATTGPTLRLRCLGLLAKTVFKVATSSKVHCVMSRVRCRGAATSTARLHWVDVAGPGQVGGEVWFLDPITADISLLVGDTIYTIRSKNLEWPACAGHLLR